MSLRACVKPGVINGSPRSTEVSTSAPPQPPGASGNGSERALERPHPDSRRAAAQKPNRPQRSLRAQDRSRRASSRHRSPAPAPPLCHRKTGESTKVYAAFLQNAPVVRHTRGFTPGWYAAPRWGTPNASPPPSLPAPPRGGSGNGSERALERPHPEPRRAAARKPNRPQRSLRAQDRSRWRPTGHTPWSPDPENWPLKKAQRRPKIGRRCR